MQQIVAWASGRFSDVSKSTKKLSKKATETRRKARDYARSHKAKPIVNVPIVPKAERLKRLDYSKEGQIIPGQFYERGPRKGQPKRYRAQKRKDKKSTMASNLPLIDSNTIAHDVRGFSLEDVLLVLCALRDRGSPFRVVYRIPKGLQDYNGDISDGKARGSSAPLDAEGMEDEELWDWLYYTVLQGGKLKPLYVMEMLKKK